MKLVVCIIALLLLVLPIASTKNTVAVKLKELAYAILDERYNRRGKGKPNDHKNPRNIVDEIVFFRNGKPNDLSKTVLKLKPLAVKILSSFSRQALEANKYQTPDHPRDPMFVLENDEIIFMHDLYYKLENKMKGIQKPIRKSLDEAYKSYTLKKPDIDALRTQFISISGGFNKYDQIYIGGTNKLTAEQFFRDAATKRDFASRHKQALDIVFGKNEKQGVILSQLLDKIVFDEYLQMKDILDEVEFARLQLIQKLFLARFNIHTAFLNLQLNAGYFPNDIQMNQKVPQLSDQSSVLEARRSSLRSSKRYNSRRSKRDTFEDYSASTPALANGLMPTPQPAPSYNVQVHLKNPYGSDNLQTLYTQQAPIEGSGVSAFPAPPAPAAPAAPAAASTPPPPPPPAPPLPPAHYHHPL